MYIVRHSECKKLLPYRNGTRRRWTRRQMDCPTHALLRWYCGLIVHNRQTGSGGRRLATSPTMSACLWNRLHHMVDVSRSRFSMTRQHVLSGLALKLPTARHWTWLLCTPLVRTLSASEHSHLHQASHHLHSLVIWNTTLSVHMCDCVCFSAEACVCSCLRVSVCRTYMTYTSPMYARVCVCMCVCNVYTWARSRISVTLRPPVNRHLVSAVAVFRAAPGRTGVVSDSYDDVRWTLLDWYGDWWGT